MLYAILLYATVPGWFVAANYAWEGMKGYKQPLIRYAITTLLFAGGLRTLADALDWTVRSW